MYILDTNVISKMMSPTPDKKVIRWIDELESEEIWTTSVSLYELQYGIEILPEGKRRKELGIALEDTLLMSFRGNILVFDEGPAIQSAILSAKLRKLGRPVEVRDVMIGGIVAWHGATLVTRNEKHFVDTGINILNPWNE